MLTGPAQPNQVRPAAGRPRAEWALRGLRVAAGAWADVTVEVPPMGDSITEGSIAEVNKAAGDQVRPFSQPAPLRPWS